MAHQESVWVAGSGGARHAPESAYRIAHSAGADCKVSVTPRARRTLLSARGLLRPPLRRAYPVVMPLAPEYFTAELVRAIPDDGNRYELVWGELLVTPAPRGTHQRIVGRLFRALADACDARGGLEAMLSPADISWGADTLVQPDVFVVPKNEAVTGDWSRIRSLVLVAEVLSPATARLDRFQKRKLYQQHGVPILWLVDAERRLIEVWTPSATFPTVETEHVTWRPPGKGSPLVIPIAELFRPD